MVLARLWAEETAKGSRRLRLATLEALGGPQRIIRAHLDEALDRLPAGEREVAARVLHHLVTPSGTKVAHTATDLAGYAGLPADQVRSVLEGLSASGARVLRTVAAPPGQDGESRYEIFHDVLAPAILAWRANWQARRQAQAAAERRFEERARRWRRGLARAAVLVAVVVVVALAGLAAKSRWDELVARRQADQAELAATIAAGRARRPTWRGRTRSASGAGRRAGSWGRHHRRSSRSCVPAGSNARSRSARRRAGAGSCCGGPPARRPSSGRS
jgi:hypothetical protein